MALNAAIVFEIRTGGSDTNGGGFKTGATGTDWTLQDSAQYSVTDGVTNGTTTITSASANFGTDVVGNLIYVQGGTGSVAAERYEIISRTNATTIVVDRITGLTAGTGVTLKIGGALATPGQLGLSLTSQGVAGHKAYIKAGTYNLSSATANISGGALDLSGASSIANKHFYFEGYQTTRGDLGTRPVISANGNAPTQIINMGGNSGGSQAAVNIKLDGTSQVINGVTGNSGLYNTTVLVEVIDCDGTQAFSGVFASFCKAYSCAANGFTSVNCYGCWADSCEIGFTTSGQAMWINCISSNNSGDGFNGFAVMHANCVAYNNGSDGFDCSSSTRRNTYFNCISFSDSAFGWNTVANLLLINCAYGADGGGSGRTNGTPVLDSGAITLSADPFTNAAGGDFSLNNAAGGGALLRALGFDPFGQTGYQDIGAVQHADPASGPVGQQSC